MTYSVSLAHDLLTNLAARGVMAKRLVADSRQVQRGDVFLAYPGAAVDGRTFIADAVARGAAAVIAERRPQVGAGETAISVPFLEADQLAAQCGELAAEVYGHPSEKLWVAGITGTNGKTSCSQWLAQALSLLGEKVGVVGTLGNGLFGALADSPNTTPDALVLQKLLADYVTEGATAASIEVSSIGVEEQRINGMHFDVAMFTNLTQDHLDYHGTMDAYAAAKEKFLHWPGLGVAVINLDDAFGLGLVSRLAADVRCIGYTLSDRAPTVSERVEVLRPTRLDLSGAGVRFTLNDVEFAVPVVGRFNVSNLLAVIGALTVKGYTLPQCAEVLAKLTPPPGRMQTLGGKDAPLVVVDYAHTPDALEKALEVLRETAHARGGQLRCVFGCGGDRDTGKRPLMGAVAQRLADRVLVTSDNPRSEVPARIVADVLAGMAAGTESELDRRAAIERVLAEAAVSDVILIAGKGHEPYQEIAGVRHPFSDIEIAKSALVERR